MKIFTSISFVLNFVLASIVSFLWLRPQSATQSFVPVKPAATPIVVEKIPARPKAAPFQWNQVESDDYPTFISNLRAINCPEETIRHLVTGEIGQIYQEKQKQYEARAQRPMLPSELRQLRQEQSAVLAEAIPPTRSTEKFTAARSGTASSSEPLPPGPAPRYPLAFAASSSGAAPVSSRTSAPVTTSVLPETAASAINQIRQEFVSQIGGANQNPSDPSYYKRWSNAQRLADDRMRSLMGAEYYNRNSIEAGLKAQKAQSP